MSVAARLFFVLAAAQLSLAPLAWADGASGARNAARVDSARLLRRVILRRHGARLPRITLPNGKRCISARGRQLVRKAARRLMKERPIRGKSLPGWMPSLPWLEAGEEALKPIIDSYKNDALGPKALYLALERHVEKLRSQSTPEAQNERERLNAYLVRYKKKWARGWLRDLVRRAPEAKLPRYRLEVSRTKPDFSGFIAQSPAKGFGYDQSFETIQQIYADVHPPEPQTILGWKVLARLERKLHELEIDRNADPQLRKDLSTYIANLTRGYAKTGVPPILPPLPEPIAQEEGAREILARTLHKSPVARYLALQARSLALKTTRSADARADRRLAASIDRYLLRARKELDFPRVARRLLDRRVRAAYTILARTMPRALEVLPELTFRLGTLYKGAQNVSRGGKKIIYLPLNVPPTTILKHLLHEIVHVSEERSLRAVGMAHRARASRSTGSSRGLLNDLIPGAWNYGDVEGYAGNAAHPYMLRYYADGSTEMLSVAAEKLHSLKSAEKLFEQDGAQILRMLDTFNAQR